VFGHDTPGGVDSVPYMDISTTQSFTNYGELVAAFLEEVNKFQVFCIFFFFINERTKGIACSRRRSWWLIEHTMTETQLKNCCRTSLSRREQQEQDFVTMSQPSVVLMNLVIAYDLYRHQILGILLSRNQ